MITGKFEELKGFMKAENFHKIEDFAEQIKAGKVALLEWFNFEDDELIKAIVLNKSNYKEEVKEFHKTFTDLHITIAGLDTIYTGNQVVEFIEPYQEVADYALVNSPSETVNKILPGYFALIKPGEVHSNLLSGESPLKVVIKLK